MTDFALHSSCCGRPHARDRIEESRIRKGRQNEADIPFEGLNRKFALEVDGALLLSRAVEQLKPCDCAEMLDAQCLRMMVASIGSGLERSLNTGESVAVDGEQNEESRPGLSHW